MKNINRLIRQARAASRIKGDELDHFDFRKLSMDELKELAYGNPSEERFQELTGKTLR
jgi:hypothetical protein